MTSGPQALGAPRSLPRRPRPHRRPRCLPAARGTRGGPRGRPAWSSTTRTRIGSAIADLQANRRAGAGRRADLEPPAEPPRPFLHRRQPEPARPCSPARSGSKPTPSSSTSSSSRAVVAAAADTRSRCATARGAARSGAPPARCAGPRRRARGRRAAARRRRARSRAAEPAQQLDVLAQRSAQAVLLEVRRAQLEDERAELVERLLRQRLQLPTWSRAAAGSRSSSVPAASALSTSPKSFWLTASWSSSASRFRSATIESSRLCS